VAELPPAWSGRCDELEAAITDRLWRGRLVREMDDDRYADRKPAYTTMMT
jgi:hypothetical protein